jgi:YaaC-like Protein
MNAGRRLTAGIGPFERLLSPRTSAYELWAPLRVVKTSDVGLARLRRTHGSSVNEAAHRRVVAYLTQAETFYMAAQDLAPESRPLVAYYFFLNLTKAFLTCADPTLTTGVAMHGVGDGFTRKTRYWFAHEQVKVKAVNPGISVFRELALRTGAGFCHPAGTLLEIRKLAPYLVETADLFESAVELPPRLVPLRSVDIWRDGTDTWLHVAARRSDLQRRALTPASFPSKSQHFGRVFRHVESGGMAIAYESKTAWNYGGKKILLRYPQLQDAFERSLIHINRGGEGARYLAIASERSDLLSQEAVSFAVMHHLSTMVRYRPEQVAKLANTKWFFLFTSWVPRAMENFYLALASRILGEELRITR